MMSSTTRCKRINNVGLNKYDDDITIKFNLLLTLSYVCMYVWKEKNGTEL